MPTARFLTSAATTQSAIIASMGATGLRDGKSVSCVTVEVNSTGSLQWNTANPLPALYFWMTSVTTAGTCYLLGGLDADAKDATTVVYSSVPSLIQGVTSPTHQSASHTSVMFTLGNIPICAESAILTLGRMNHIQLLLPQTPSTHAWPQGLPLSYHQQVPIT